MKKYFITYYNTLGALFFALKAIIKHLLKDIFPTNTQKSGIIRIFVLPIYLPRNLTYCNYIN